MKERKVQMMDAGTALFEMEGNFGTALGQIRAELSEFGKVHDEGEDMVLDFSTAWRKRIIRCHLEGAGEKGNLHRYAAVFMEGNGNTWLRNLVHGTMVTVLALMTVFPDALFPETYRLLVSVVCAFGTVAAAWSWMSPDRKSVRTLKRLSDKVSKTKF